MNNEKRFLESVNSHIECNEELICKLKSGYWVNEDNNFKVTDVATIVSTMKPNSILSLEYNDSRECFVAELVYKFDVDYVLNVNLDGDENMYHGINSIEIVS